jgi:NAD(P)-dependent dehydrogenase (short-subunit alcohol dehydrogenase family)
MPNALDRFRLDGQVAVVTGGARGIGRAAAEALVVAGARAVLVDRDLDEAKKAAAAIGCEAQALDVTSEADVDGFFDALAARTGRIDVLVNNAGLSIRKPSMELSKAKWDAVIAVNQSAVFLCSRAAARHMLPRKSGAIVNVASIMGFSGGGLYPNISYQASKGAVVNMTRAFAIEWAKGRHPRQRRCTGLGAHRLHCAAAGEARTGQRDRRSDADGPPGGAGGSRGGDPVSCELRCRDDDRPRARDRWGLLGAVTRRVSAFLKSQALIFRRVRARPAA